jgi:hypothetical protein
LQLERYNRDVAVEDCPLKMKTPPPDPPRAIEGGAHPNGVALGPENASEVAAYIAQMSSDLATLARSAKLGALAYLLEMTEVEAGQLTQKRD